MKIDCGTCSVRGAACADCVVTFLTIPVRGAPGVGRGPDAESVGAVGGTGTLDPPVAVDLDAAERAAIAVLASSGLVPPLRLAPIRKLCAAGAPPGAARTG